MYEDEGKGEVIELPLKSPEAVKEYSKPQRYQSEKLTRAKARHRVLELAAAGLTYEQISWETGKSPAGVRAIIRKQLTAWSEDNAEHLAEYRMQKLFELDQLKRAIWPKALRGELKAVREAARIITLQATISGAAAAQKHDHTVRVGGLEIDEKEIARMEKAWLDAAPPAELPEGETVDGTIVDG